MSAAFAGFVAAGLLVQVADLVAEFSVLVVVAHGWLPAVVSASSGRARR
jgi:hypothetical protein